MDMGHIGATCIRDCYDGGDQHCVDDEHQIGEGNFFKDTQVCTTSFESRCPVADPYL